MIYKGYTASIEVAVEAGILFGQVLGINDVLDLKEKQLMRFVKNSTNQWMTI